MNPGLLHPNPQERMATVRTLAATLPADELLGQLAPGLADQHREVRALVATLLAEAATSSPALLGELADLASAVPQEGPQALRQRVAALHALQLVGMRGPEDGEDLARARSACAQALAHESGHVRFQAISALRRLGVDAEQLPTVRALLTDGDREVVSLAAEVLALAGDQEASGRLAEAAASLRGEGRSRAILALAQLAVAGGQPHPEIVDELVGMTRDVAHGLTAIELLVQLDPKAAVPALERAAAGWLVHRLLRVAACAGLARLGVEGGLKGLREWAGSRHRDARGFALEKLGTVGDADDLAAVAAVATDRNDYHSDTAVISLAARADDFRDTLLACAQDPRPEVRAEVARVLAHHAWGAEALAKLSRDDDTEVRDAAVGADGDAAHHARD